MAAPTAPVLPPPSQATANSGSFQAALANASQQETPKNSSAASAAGAPAAQNNQSHPVVPQQRAQSPSAPMSRTEVETPASTCEATISSDHEKAASKPASAEPESAHGSSASGLASAVTVDPRIPVDAPNLPEQRPDAPTGLGAAATGHAVTHANQFSPVAQPADCGEEDSVPGIAPGGLADLVASTQVDGEMAVLPMDVPLGAALPNSATGMQSLGKSTQKDVSGAIGSEKPNLLNTSASTTVSSTDQTSGMHDASSHASQGNNQSSQDVQPIPASAAAAMQKAPDSGAAQPQTQTLAMSAPNHDLTAAHREAAGLADSTRANDVRASLASAPSDSADTAAASGINSARLIQAISETGMHVGMHSTEFGDISIRTSISQQQMLTRISLDHSELSQAISAHVSSVQAKLGNDYGLHASIEINNQGSSFSGDPGTSSQGEPRASANSGRNETTAEPLEGDNGMNMGMLALAGDGNRLDIRA